MLRCGLCDNLNELKDIDEKVKCTLITFMIDIFNATNIENSLK
jgi:hypothetical protein